MKKIKSILKFILKLFLILVSFIAIWILAALLLPKIKINQNFSACHDDCVTMYLRSNGMHTDIVFPVINNEKDWRAAFPIAAFEGVDSTFNYIAIGWGDKGFYLETPTWADLKVSTALKAMVGVSGTAMHITYLKNAPVEGEYGRQLKISKEQYYLLLNYIDDAFKKDDNGNVLLIKHPDYDINDNYYEAKGSYSVFRTCNVWTSQCLKSAGIQNGYWTPSAASVMQNLP